MMQTCCRSDAMSLLMRFAAQKKDSQKLVSQRPNVSPAVPIEPGKVILLTPGTELVSPAESASAPAKSKTVRKCTVQESNLQPSD